MPLRPSGSGPAETLPEIFSLQTPLSLAAAPGGARGPPLPAKRGEGCCPAFRVREGGVYVQIWVFLMNSSLASFQGAF